jgi:hypothetical protein
MICHVEIIEIPGTSAGKLDSKRRYARLDKKKHMIVIEAYFPHFLNERVRNIGTITIINIPPISNAQSS